MKNPGFFSSMQPTFWVVLALVVLFGTGCDTGGGSDAAGTVSIRFLHEVDGDILVRDNTYYQNAAGNELKVSLLEYIITDFRLVKADGSETLIKQFQYVNDSQSSTVEISDVSIGGGNYSEVAFTFGVPPGKAAMVPNTLSFSGMAWPAQMAGGVAGLFHNMRLEGKYKRSATPGDEGSFLTHTGPSGGNDFSFEVRLPVSLRVDGNQSAVDVIMDIAQWYETPNVVDLASIDPPAIMGNLGFQQVFFQNGNSVFAVASSD